MTLEEASAEIADAKLKVGRVEEEVSDEIPEGEVIDQSPVAETSVDAGSKVNLTVSSGPEAVTVPDVVGMTEEEAVATIQDAGLDVQINRGPSNDYEEGIVASQDPGAGAEAAAGDTVVILVSEGPEEQEMPDVTGRNGDEAEAFLEDDPYNLVVTQQDADPSQCGAVPPGTVCAQSPASGEPVSPGDSATLYVQPGDAALPGNGAFAWASVFSLFLFFA
jgi:serine/threonine-protein kinase